MFGYIGASYQVFALQQAKKYVGVTEVFDVISEAKKWMEDHPDATLIVEMPHDKDERYPLQEALINFNKRIIAIEDGAKYDPVFFGNPPKIIFQNNKIKEMNESICKIIKSITLGTAETI